MRAFLAIVFVLGCGSDKKPPETKPTPPAPAPVPEAPANLGGIEVPVVPPQGLVPLDDMAIIVSATPTRISVEGTAVVELHEGAVGPEELEGGALGMKIPKLGQLLASIPIGGPDPDKASIRLDGERGNVVLALDKSLPAKLVMQIVFTAKSHGFKSFGIAVLAGGKPMMVPLALPDRTPSSSLDMQIAAIKKGAPDANLGPPMPVQPVVTILKDKVMVWSISGLYGTLQEPRLDLADPRTAAAALTKNLAAFVASRWSGGTRTDPERELVIMPDKDLPLQTLVALMAAARADDAGHELFPMLVLSPGLE